jgi:cell division protein FtsX
MKIDFSSDSKTKTKLQLEMRKILAFLQRSFCEGSIQLWRNKFLSFSTIGLGALVLFLLNFVFSIQFFADLSLKNIESRADFLIELRSDFDTFEFDSMLNELSIYDLETTFLETENFDDFTVPPRLQIKFKNLQEVSSVFEILKKTRYDMVVGDWDGAGERDFVNLISKLLKVRDGVNSATKILIFVFVLGGILLAFNAFRVVIFSRREEIFIARIVGASPNFIAAPFVLEGNLLGFIASFVAIFVFIFVLREIEILPGGAIFLFLWNNVFPLEILISGLVGAFGAWIAVSKYLSGKFERL